MWCETNQQLVSIICTAEPSDYSTDVTEEVVSISSGVSRGVVKVGVVNDTEVEGEESFSVSLRVEQGGVRVGGVSSAIITITDDDSEWTVH